MSVYRKLYAVISKSTVVLFTVATGAIILGGTALWMVEQEIVARAGESLALEALEIVNKLNAQLQERDGDIQILAASPEVRSRDLPTIRRHLEAVQAAYPVYSRLAVTDQKGRVIVSTDQAWVGEDFQQASWFQAAWHAPRVHAETVEKAGQVGGSLQAVRFSAPVMEMNGTFRGVVMTEVDRIFWNGFVEDRVNQFAAQTKRFGVIRYRVLAHNGDVLLTFGHEEHAGVNLQALGLPSALQLALGRSGYVEEEHLTRRVPVITGYARTEGVRGLSQLQWGVLVRADRAGVLEHVRALLFKLGLAGLAGFGLMLGALLWANTNQRKEQQRLSQAKQALIDNEAQLRAVFETAVDGIITINDQGMILSFNPAAEIIFGYSAREVVGESVTVLMPKPFASEHAGYMSAYLRTGQKKVIGIGREVMGRRKDGSVFPLDLAVNEMQIGSGRCFTGIIRDITERNDMVSRLRASEMFFRLLSEQLPIGVFEIGEDGTCLYKNKMWDAVMERTNEEVFGFASVALPEGSWIEWVHPEDREQLTKAWTSAQASFGRLHMECRLAPIDDRIRWVELVLWTMVEDRGVRYLGTMQDITTQKNMVERLSTSQMFFRLLSDHLPIGVFEIDYRGGCLYGNRMWRSLFGVDLGDEGTRQIAKNHGTWLEWFHPDDREMVAEEWDKTRVEFDRMAVECRLAGPDAEPRWVQVLLWPMTTEEGIRFLGTLEDITERKRTVAQTISLLHNGRFQFRSMSEARNLAGLLAQAFPDPSRALLGLTELLANAVEHGNLDISYSEKSKLLDQGRLDEELSRRLADPRNREKQVRVLVDRTDTEIRIVIADDGEGFDWAQYLEWGGPRSDDSHGRGIAISKHISFDRLEYRGRGNEVVVSSRLNGPEHPVGQTETKMKTKAA